MGKNKLIYGLGGGLIYSLGGNGSWKNVLPKVLRSFDNPVLVSAVDMPLHVTEFIYKVVGKERMCLDSGGFTLYKKQLKLSEVEFAKECNRMRNKFLKMLNQAEYSMIFELDNEYFRYEKDMLSPKNYCRQDVKDLTGQYPIPVFKLHQGFQYWKDLCDSSIYSKLSIGGLAQTCSWDSHRDEIRKMLNYARLKNKSVHLLGCQNVETFRFVKPTTVDYSIFQYAINLAHAKKEKPNLTEYKDLKVHAALYAFARAKSRSFLYENIGGESSED